MRNPLCIEDLSIESELLAIRGAALSLNESAANIDIPRCDGKATITVFSDNLVLTTADVLQTELLVILLKAMLLGDGSAAPPVRRDDVETHTAVLVDDGIEAAAVLQTKPLVDIPVTKRLDERGAAFRACVIDRKA